MSRRSAQLLTGLGGAIAGAGSAAAVEASIVWILSGLVVGASLGIAHAHPRAAWILTAGAIAVGIGAGEDVPEGLTVLALVHTLLAGRWDELPSSAIGLAAIVTALVAVAATTDSSGVPYVFMPAAAWGAGRALGEREKVASQLAIRARELEEEREAHAELSVRYERARIASELHDIVAHAISVMVVQASAGQRLVESDPEATARTFESIAGAAHQAEQDIGRLVALLGDEDAIGAAPDLALLDELVARAAGSGLNVTLRLEGRREGLPAPVAEAAYRIVQEGLTNAMRYASGAAVEVLVAADGRELVVEVRNGEASGGGALAGVGGGNGLRGLRERVAACGGRLEAAPSGGGWRLAARIPLRSLSPNG